MLACDRTYRWEGWGGRLQLGSGKCRLRIYDLSDRKGETLIHLRPCLVVVEDAPTSKMSVKSCASHIATRVVKDYRLDKDRMLWIEYYPGKVYGANSTKRVPESYEAVEFTWHGNKAIRPRWRTLESRMRDMVKDIMTAGVGPSTP